jgi:hypothetical protein
LPIKTGEWRAKKKGAQGEYWPKLQKQTKILFYLSFSIRGTALHVMRISDSKFFFRTQKRLGFYPIKIKTSLLKRAFLET